jgi:hypothetical protein
VGDVVAKQAKSDFGDKMVDAYEFTKKFISGNVRTDPDGPGLDPQVVEQVHSDCDKLKEKYKAW